MTLAGKDAHFVEDFDLGTGENGGLGMVCGGKVKVLFYSVKRRIQRLHLFKGSIKDGRREKAILAATSIFKRIS